MGVFVRVTWGYLLWTFRGYLLLLVINLRVTLGVWWSKGSINIRGFPTLCACVYVSTIFGFNKDHQRMIVDPMFMIIQNSRLFLNAVTPTAVAPTAVIL